jgi:hypothetical protein
MKHIPAFTLIGPWAGDNTWTVTLNDYDYGRFEVCSQLRFNTKEEAEAFIAESRRRRDEIAEQTDFPF